MNLIDRLERRFGAYAIPGLVRIIVLFSGLVFILSELNPALIGVIELTPDVFTTHEYWRLITFLFIPRVSSIFIIFALLFLWSIGETLEQEWGAFRLNLFCLLGMIGTAVAAVIFKTPLGNTMLYTTLLFAYAHFRPNQMMLFPPVPIKWLAFFIAGWMALQFFTGTWAMRAAIFISLANYFLFFGPAFLANAQQRRRVEGRRRQFEENSLPRDAALHQCAVCQRTEHDGAELEFRVSSRDGQEYCLEHLPKAP